MSTHAGPGKTGVNYEMGGTILRTTKGMWIDNTRNAKIKGGV